MHVSVGVEDDATAHRLLNRVRLFVNFLLHKVIKVSLHDLLNLHSQRLNRTLDFSGFHRRSIRQTRRIFALGVNLLHAIDAVPSVVNVRHVVVLQVQHALSVLYHGRCVGSEVKFHRRPLRALRRRHEAFARHQRVLLSRMRSLGDAQEQRRPALRRHQLPRVMPRFKRQRVRPLQLSQHLHHQLSERALIVKFIE